MLKRAVAVGVGEKGFHWVLGPSRHHFTSSRRGAAFCQKLFNTSLRLTTRYVRSWSMSIIVTYPLSGFDGQVPNYNELDRICPQEDQTGNG